MNVLICVDNPGLRHALEGVVDLIEPFHAAGLASDAPSLLAQMEQIDVSIVIVDQKILEKNGRNLLPLLNKRYPRVRILQVGDWRAVASPPSQSVTPAEVVPYDATVEQWSEALRRAGRGLREPRARVLPRPNLRRLTLDAVALSLLLGFSAFLARDLFAGEFLLTGYTDWTYHAFRIKSLQAYGFLNWSNDWAGGFPLWQSYQFGAHVATLAVTWITGWSVTRAMSFETAVLFVVFRPMVYCGLRLSGFHAPAALVGSMLTLAIVGYYSPVSDFSYLWGVTLFPIVIFLLAARETTPRRAYLAALITGLGVHVHTLLFVLGTIALLCHLVTCRDLAIRKSLNSLAILILASSFFWVPTLFSDKPAYVNEWTLSPVFMRSLLPMQWLGLGPSLVATAFGVLALGLGVLGLDMTNRRLFVTTVATFVVVLVAIAVTYFGLAPATAYFAQATRWTTFLGILLSILGAFVAQGFLARAGRRAMWFLALAVIYIVADALVTARADMPRAISQQPESKIAQFLDDDGRVTYADRLATSSGIEVSYFYFGKVRLAANYFGQAAYEILYPALEWFLFSNDKGSLQETKDPTLTLAYLKAVGATLVATGENDPLAQVLLPDGELAGTLPLRNVSRGYALFETPGKHAQAIITSPTIAGQLAFPNIKYDTDEQHKLRDRLVVRFAETIDAPDTIIPEVTYPSQTGVRVVAPNVQGDRYLIVLAPYDGSWEARVNGNARKVERAGPNYIGLDLSGAHGTIQVDLSHEMHWTWKVGIALASAGVLLHMMLSFLGSRLAPTTSRLPLGRLPVGRGGAR